MSNFQKVLEILQEDKKELNKELAEIKQKLNSMKGGYSPNLHNDKTALEFSIRRKKLIDRKTEILDLLKK